jgi:TctA family transporter
MSEGSLSIFWANGLVTTIMAAALLLLAWPLLSKLRLRRPRPA